MARILVACEHSARVRDAFRDRGHDAWSCDLLPTDGDPTWHLQRDVRLALAWGQWDCMIAFPPCTYLACSGNRWHAGTTQRTQALAFAEMLLNADVQSIALENPVGAISSKIRKPDQVIQPWQFGHGETKATCLWLKNLPRLEPTDIVDGRETRIHRMGEIKNRGKLRSLTYPGVAEAMAAQWGAYLDWYAESVA